MSIYYEQGWAWLDSLVEPADGYSPEDPEDAFEPVGPYTAEDLAFLVNSRMREDADKWTSEPPRTGE